MQQENTTQIGTDTQKNAALHGAEFENIGPDENGRRLAASETTENESGWLADSDPFGEDPSEQHIQFPISFADWGPRNSLL